MGRRLARRFAVATAVVLLLVFGVAPAALLHRARAVRGREEAAAARSGKAIEDTLAAVLARLAAWSPPFSAAARREEATFWLALAESGGKVERRTGATRRLSRRIARAYSDAIRADAAFAAPRAVPRLNARSR